VLLLDYSFWQRRLENIETSNYRNAMEDLALCNPKIYPNIFKILTISSTQPVLTVLNKMFFNIKKNKNILMKNYWSIKS